MFVSLFGLTSDETARRPVRLGSASSLTSGSRAVAIAYRNDFVPRRTLRCDLSSMQFILQPAD
jgi:hypothetical protein